MQHERGDIVLPPPSPLFIVITGPSGVGKDAVLDGLRAAGANRHFVVTATTRPPREGERDGVHYHFLQVDRFLRLRAQGYFLEHAEVYGNYYGTPRDEVIPPLRRGQDVLLRTDVQGATTLRSSLPGTLVIFLAPERLDDLEERVRRPNEPPASVARRLAEARRECGLIPTFDYVVVNRRGALDQTVATVEAIITAEHARTHPRQLALP